MTHPLDNPAWLALTGRHAALAQGDGAARRYRPGVSVFAGMPDSAAASFAALREALTTEAPVALFTAWEGEPPPEFQVLSKAVYDQMICERLEAPPEGPPADLLELDSKDGPEMQALVALTEPGPFTAETWRMGRYVGVRAADGTLAGMAGERLRPEQYCEISAVCTHPEHRGKGLARALTGDIAAGIVARGETPFLHVHPANAAAISVYLRLGFSKRRDMHVTVLRRL